MSPCRRHPLCPGPEFGACTCPDCKPFPSIPDVENAGWWSVAFFGAALIIVLILAISVPSWGWFHHLLHRWYGP